MGATRGTAWRRHSARLGSPARGRRSSGLWLRVLGALGVASLTPGLHSPGGGEGTAGGSRCHTDGEDQPDERPSPSASQR